MSKIGLVDVDSKIPNLALMKISAWHKKKGDEVSFYQPLFDSPDKIYGSKVFDYTEDYCYYPDIIVEKGGIGYNMKKLPSDIEGIYPDYDLYNCGYAMGFATRGCVRNCPWCVVPEKEGNIKAVADIYNFWRGQKEMVLLDNNLTAEPKHFEKILNQIIKERIKIDFNQGLDIRLIDRGKAQLLSKILIWKQLRFAWDSMDEEKDVKRGIKILDQAGIKRYRLMFYVLVGYDTSYQEDFYRVETLRQMGIDPFVMVYNKKSDLLLQEYARWNNRFYFRGKPFKGFLVYRGYGNLADKLDELGYEGL